MKRLLIYFMLLIAIPATAQVRPHHDGHSHHSGHGVSSHVHTAPVAYGYAYGMHHEDFEEVVMMLSQESFDSDRLSIAKQIVAHNSMTTSQIARVCELFTFESNRLEFAKFAYPFCVDRNKYYQINSVFTFNASKRELREYIKGR